jgi:hypothetical protein
MTSLMVPVSFELANIFSAIPSIFPTIPFVLTAVPSIFFAVPHILPAVPAIFAAVPYVLAPIPAVFLAIEFIFPTIPAIFGPIPANIPFQMTHLPFYPCFFFRIISVRQALF